MNTKYGLAALVAGSALIAGCNSVSLEGRALKSRVETAKIDLATYQTFLKARELYEGRLKDAQTDEEKALLNGKLDDVNKVLTAYVDGVKMKVTPVLTIDHPDQGRKHFGGVEEPLAEAWFEFNYETATNAFGADGAKELLAEARPYWVSTQGDRKAAESLVFRMPFAKVYEVFTRTLQIGNKPVMLELLTYVNAMNGAGNVPPATSGARALVTEEVEVPAELVASLVYLDKKLETPKADESKDADAEKKEAK